MKSKIILDINGDKLKLTPTRLVEVDYDESDARYRPWYALYSDLAVANRRRGIRICETGTKRRGQPFSLIVLFRRPTNALPLGYIGCRTFTRETFNEIVRAARMSTKTQAAKAAKAGAQ